MYLSQHQKASLWLFHHICILFLINFLNFLIVSAIFVKVPQALEVNPGLPHVECGLRQQSSGMSNLLTTKFAYSFIYFLSQNKKCSNTSILLKIVLNFNLRKIHICFLLLLNFRFFSIPRFTY